MRIEKLKEIALKIGYVVCIVIGIISLYNAGKWMYYVYLQDQMTGPLSNFILAYTIGLIFTFEAYIDYSKTFIYVKEKEILPAIIGIICLILAAVIYVFFAFSSMEQFINFSIILSLEGYGFFMIDLPRLYKAKLIIDTFKN